MLITPHYATELQACNRKKLMALYSFKEDHLFIIIYTLYLQELVELDPVDGGLAFVSIL